MDENEQKLQQDIKQLLQFAQNGHKYIIHAIYNVMGNKLLQHGYIDAGYILRPSKYGVTKGTYYTKLSGSKIRALFGRGCIPSENIEVMLEYMHNIIVEDVELNNEEEKALLFWIFLPYCQRQNRLNREIYLSLLLTHFLENWYRDKQRHSELRVCGEVLFDADFCNIELITSVEEYAKFTFSLKEKNNNLLFYRGHSLLDYELVPGIKRNKSWYKNENVMYQELLVRCAQNFSHCQTHLEYLVEMQHYGLPTRLLDITENPLVALYFACCRNKERLGEVIVLTTGNEHVRYSKSDTAALLAALPTLSHEEQMSLYSLCTNQVSEDEDEKYKRLAGKLAGEVKSRNPAFEPRIKKKDLVGYVFVTPIRSNQRIMKQDGSFIICGLMSEHSDSNILDGLRCCDADNKRLILLVKNKEKILKELDTLSINRATLFPEIDYVAEYLKEKYNV